MKVSFLQSKKGKAISVFTALLLVAAIIVACVIDHEHRRYACQYAKSFEFSKAVENSDVQLVAHRGIAREAPENTLPAYELAAKAGYRYVETDIHVTADGVWVLSHDSNLKRMTGFSGVIEEITLAEVTAHKIIKGANADDYPTLTTPTLEAFLALCSKAGMIPIIEIKTYLSEYPDAPVEAVLHLLEEYALEEEAVIISFDYDSLERVRAYSADIREQFLVKGLDESVFTKVEKLGNCGIDCAYKGLIKAPQLCQLALNNHIVLNAWTVDSEKACEKVTALGVAFITTNAALPVQE